MRIGLAGDWHAHFKPVRSAIRALEQNRVQKILHVGDFGFYGNPAGKQFIDMVDGLLAEAGMEIYVTPGNHEDYDYLQSIDHVAPWNEWMPVRDTIHIARRGFTWEWDGCKFLSLGGAPSVDRTWRQQLHAQAGGRKTWWAEEFITDQDVETTLAAAERFGLIDVMIGHDAPFYEQLDRIIAPNPHGFPTIDLQYAHEGRKQMHRAVHGVMPTLFVHGHYHVATDSVIGWSSLDSGPNGWSTADIIGHTDVVGLNKEMDPGSLAILDTDDLSVTRIN